MGAGDPQGWTVTVDGRMATQPRCVVDLDRGGVVAGRDPGEVPDGARIGAAAGDPAAGGGIGMPEIVAVRVLGRGAQLDAGGARRRNLPGRGLQAQLRREVGHGRVGGRRAPRERDLRLRLGGRAERQRRHQRGQPVSHRRSPCLTPAPARQAHPEFSASGAESSEFMGLPGGSASAPSPTTRPGLRPVSVAVPLPRLGRAESGGGIGGARRGLRPVHPALSRGRTSTADSSKPSRRRALIPILPKSSPRVCQWVPQPQVGQWWMPIMRSPQT